jgi:hypothetical protein
MLHAGYLSKGAVLTFDCHHNVFVVGLFDLLLRWLATLTQTACGMTRILPFAVGTLSLSV